MLPQPELASLIDWKFTVTLDRFSARYGLYAGRYWKQVTPAGMILSAIYPPRPIHPNLYELAQRQANGR